MDDLKQRLRAATEGVTPGPWRVVERQAEDDPDETALDMLDGRGWRIMSHGDGYYADVPDRDDWPFIAAARTLIPEAAAALDALEAENARLRDHVQDLIRVCEENDIHDMTLAAVAADLSLTHQ